jgi:hypothetical protein
MRGCGLPRMRNRDHRRRAACHETGEMYRHALACQCKDRRLGREKRHQREDSRYYDPCDLPNDGIYIRCQFGPCEPKLSLNQIGDVLQTSPTAWLKAECRKSVGMNAIRASTRRETRMHISRRGRR